MNTTLYVKDFHGNDSRFVQRLLSWFRLERFVASTSIPSLNRNFVHPQLVGVPPVAEQRRIAEILDTLDAAIEQTERLIAKLRQMKQGLLHDLLTRGIDDNGALRDPERHPEQFRDSPMGFIPKDWALCSVGELLVRPPQNGLYKSAAEIGSGVLMVGQTAFTAERSIDFALARRARVSGGELRNWGLRADDILVSRVFATLDGVAQPILVPTVDEPAVFESNMMRLAVDGGRIRPGLLCHWLRSSTVRRQIAGAVNASNQCSINQKGLSGILVGVPTVEEQDTMLEVLTGHESRLAAELSFLAKLHTLKHGLMHDLLTGRARVETAT